MELLDLPPEILQRILHDFVATVGIRKAWNARAVCRTFAVEIQYNVLHLQPLIMRDFGWIGCHWGTQPLPRAYLPSIIRSRLSKPLNTFPGFLGKVRDLIGFLCGESDVYQQEPTEHLKELFESLALLESLHGLAAALTSDSAILMNAGWNKYSDILQAGPLYTHHKIIAAVMIKDNRLVQKLLPTLLQTDEWACDFFGSPLCLAVTKKDKKTVRTILRWLEGIIRTGIAVPGYLNPREQRHEVINAFRGAFRKGNLEILRDLLSFYSKHFGPANRYPYDDWLRSAYRISDTRYLKAVLAVAKTGRAVISHEGLVCAMRVSTANHIKTLIAAKALDVHGEFFRTTPLIAAVRGGNLDNIRAVLDAGADVNAVLEGGWNPSSALAAAFRTHQKQKHKVRIVQLLLKRGSTLPPVDTWPEVGKRGTSQIRALLEEEQKKRSAQN